MVPSTTPPGLRRQLGSRRTTTTGELIDQAEALEAARHVFGGLLNPSSSQR
jgi:hypothetical protein